MEIIGEVFFALFEVLAELVLQIVFEILAELGFRSIREPFRRPEPLDPWLAGLGYLILGAVAGTLSLWVFPVLFIKLKWLRVAILLLTPLAAGGLMAALGAWRRRKDQELVRLDRFTYGCLFAFAMALVRLLWGK